MYVHRSNRTERLVDELVRLVAQPAGGPLAGECIVVQGKGMERWVTLELTRRLGVWANPYFPFPRHLILRAVRAALGAAPALAACFEPEILMWSITDLLPSHLDRPEFAALRTYLAPDDRGTRRIQLAERIARILDQYVVYRPGMVLDWERGADTHWQAVLWRSLVARHGAHHIAARARALLDVLQRPSVVLADFPGRVSIFGVSTLPPLYLQILAALARHIEVHLFLLSPSSEYWAGIRSQREILRLLAKGGHLADIEAALHLDEGPPLLASLGHVGADFQRVLESTVDYQEPDRDLYEDPGTATMLTTLQSDILGLRHRTPGNADTPALPLDPADDSIRVHSCHSPMREVEVLHDQLLALFEADPTLQPHDVLVMSPNIDAYAPYIDAVFGASDHQPQIPYRIADRAVHATEDIVAAFLAVLTALRGRLTANEVLDLLGLAPIRERFGFLPEEIDQVRRWLKEAGVRWGIDAAHRAAAGQPALAENTWRFGLDRLLLGYAMAGDGRRLFNDVLPYDDVEGTEAELLGRLGELCDQLFGFVCSLQAPRTLAAWRDALGALLAAMVASTRDTAYQNRAIHAALAELAEQARLGQFEQPVDLDVVQMQLATALEGGAPGRAFLTGGITFCALVPMRSVPFRVVCLLGMNDADFPRVQRPLGFDLLAQRPMPGDRSSRDDDRYLFLESLLSARERLIITYVGQSIRDNSNIPPSVVLSELLDVLGESFLPPPNDQTSSVKLLVTPHPLQAFSPRYFTSGRDPRLFSYARTNYAGAQALRGPLTAVPPFVAAPLPSAAPAVLALGLDELVRFFENPCRAFLQNRVALYLGRDITRLSDREPLELDQLERWQLGNGLLERAVGGEDLQCARSSVRASGALPPGVLGQCLFDATLAEVNLLASDAGAVCAAPLPPFSVDHELEGTRITGVIRNLFANGQVRYQFSKLGGRHELGLWIRHLVLNWVRPSGYPLATYLIGRAQKDRGPTTIRFRPVDDAQAILRDLVRMYWVGQTAPLLLFERASRTYVECIGKGRAEALTRARRAFFGDEYTRGDSNDEYVKQIFAGRDPLDPRFRFGSDPRGQSDPSPSFAELALQVYQPFLAHREETP